MEAARSEAALARVAAIEATRGGYADVFGDDYLAELREDWPE